MNMLRLIIIKEFNHIKADTLLIRLMIFPVLAQLFVLGYALTTEVKNTPIAILDQSRTPQSVSLGNRIQASSLFKFKGFVTSSSGLFKLLQQGDIRVGLVIPPDFSSTLQSPKGAAIQLLVDGQDAMTSGVAGGYVNAIVFNWSMEWLEQKLARQGIRIEQMIPVDVMPQIRFNPGLKSSWYMIPGLVVFLVTIITGLLTAFSIVKEKESGTLEQLLVTPVKPVHIIIGKCIPFMILGILEMCLFLVLSTLWFGIPFRGNVLTLLIFGCIYMISSLGIGILISTIAKSAQQVLFMIWFILIFFILLSGFFLPVENMPHWVQTVTRADPVRYFVFIVREIFLKGSGFAELWREGLSMLVIGIIVFGGAILMFRRRVG